MHISKAASVANVTTILETIKLHQTKEIISIMDFLYIKQKVFDKINWSFIIKYLSKFGSINNLIIWIIILYPDIYQALF